MGMTVPLSLVVISSPVSYIARFALTVMRPSSKPGAILSSFPLVTPSLVFTPFRPARSA
jgi:hypothetical protein